MHFFGYAMLEQWAAVADRARPVYAISLLEPGGGREQLEHRRQIIQVVQPDERGDLQYCRINLGVVAYLYGKPFEPEPVREEKVARQQAAWELVRAWLQEQGFTIREASVAVPLAYQWMEGWAAFLKWDPERKTFHRGDHVLEGA